MKLVKDVVRRQGKAIGTRDASNHPKICVKFENDTFDRINEYAASTRISFGGAVRALICYAFDKLDEEQKDDEAGKGA